MWAMSMSITSLRRSAMSSMLHVSPFELNIPKATLGCDTEKSKQLGGWYLGCGLIHTQRADPVFSVSAVLVISHRHVQRPFPQGILCSITLAMDITHHQVEGTTDWLQGKKSYFTTSIGLKRNSKDITIYRFVVHWNKLTLFMLSQKTMF